MADIEEIERIGVDLFKLKPIEAQKKVYESYRNYLNQFFIDGKEKENCFEETACPICNKVNAKILKIFDNFKYYRCRYCDCIYNNPHLKSNFLERMYENGEYEEYVKQLTLPGKNIRENITELRKFEQVYSLFDKPGNLLDVGCGTGTFLHIAEKNGWDVRGIDLSQTAIEKTNSLGIKIEQTSFERYTTKDKYDCICFWGVLEHLNNPLGQLEKACSILNNHGVIVFEVPSSESMLMQYVIQNDFTPYRFIENARHLLFFSKKSIEIICNNIGLELIYLESNGLDLQTVLLNEFDENIIGRIISLQRLCDINLQGDHYRVFLKKI
nr:class I SAM-dependent methyltransferase [Bacteroidota bacterium]